MSSFDDIGNLYMEILEEKSGHGDTKKILMMLKNAMDKKLVEVDDKKKGFMVRSLVDDSQLLIHRGESSLHPLRRYLLGLEKFIS